MDQKEILSLDYAPLKAPVTKETRERYYAVHPRSFSLSKPVKIFLIFVVAFLSFSAIFLTQESVSFGAISWVVILWTVGILGFFGWRIRIQNMIKLQSFADRNKLTYLIGRADPGYAGMIFGQGRSRFITEALFFPNFEIGNYEYVTGSGKNSQTHTYGYIKIPLKRPIPHIVLDAKKNNLFGKISNLPVSFSQSQTLELEGDFSNYFTLYVPETYERDALYILTPDVMAMLVDETNPYDLEALGTELYLYTTQPFKLMLQSTYETIAKQVNALNAEFVEQASDYKDERVALTDVAFAPQGSKLRTSIHPMTIIVVGAVICYFLFFYIIPILLFRPGS